MAYKQKTDPEDYESAKDYEREHGPVNPYDPDAPKKKKSPLRLALEILGVALIIFIYAFWIVRINLAEDPSAARKFVWTEARMSAYAADPDGYYVYTQKLDGRIDKDGRVKVSRLFIDYETGSVQFTARYSDSTAERAAELYGESRPDGECIVFTLEDGAGNVYDSYVWIPAKRWMYNWRRVVFEGVDLENASELTVKSYYINHVDPEEPFSSLPLWCASPVSYRADTGKAPSSADKTYPSPQWLTLE